MERQADVRALARDLVSVPSHESEAAAGDRIESWLREHTDAAVTRDDAGGPERGGNVIARKGSGETSLALVGHHDVVPPDESQVDGGEYVVREDPADGEPSGGDRERTDRRLHGRGSADMKGAVAAAMCAFRDSEVRRTSGSRTASGDGEPPAGVELVFASFVGEEVGGVGARAAIDDGFAPDYAVVGEGSTGYSAPGVTDVAVAHKGRRGSTLVAEGSAAHASEVESGVNAIYRATDAVDAVRDLSFPATEVLGHELSGSVAVTGIEGGSAWNVIPERCEVTVDERTVPGERADLERVESVDGVTWSVDQDLPPMACDDAAFADAVLAAARDAHEIEGATASGDDGATPDERPAAPGDGAPEQVVKPHATDAGWLADAGTTCVVCGPSEPGEAHTATESVSLPVLDRCYRIYRGVAESWGG
ncbi:acetylornithine deacetylase [Halosimplex carlsbadense 2-9-1]|uniref:Acetylornithine deacetylase n=1 Tax=Halosimplex carlsbadense 2-9-1 TaxID=797114 RepID=M0D4F1_9EURY|nr:M20/M25/M40 family metallo-hydrolase [Halosimplex carlsbadense]ELZ29733.1 acetylornithine deacetylase [Halosimplex carlsbadense 2-9-1]